MCELDNGVALSKLHTGEGVFVMTAKIRNVRETAVSRSRSRSSAPMFRSPRDTPDLENAGSTDSIERNLSRFGLNLPVARLVVRQTYVKRLFLYTFTHIHQNVKRLWAVLQDVALYSLLTRLLYQHVGCQPGCVLGHLRPMAHDGKASRVKDGRVSLKTCK